MPPSPESIVIDIETAIDKQLISDVIFEDQNMDPEEAYIEYRRQLKEKNGSDFISVFFHYPITIGYAHVGLNYRIKKVGTLPRGDEGVYKLWEAINKGFRLITWNGRSFDMPVMEQAAFRLGIPAKDYYNSKYGARYRYSEDGHYDLYDFVTNSGVVYFRGGLNAMSKMIGLPGKVGSVRGSEVQQAYEDGRHDEIDAYCVGDVLITVGMYLHVEYIRGRLTKDEYDERMDDVKGRIAAL